MTWGTLYVVGTPLGHLGDLSQRAAEVLRTVTLVAAEDTRRTRKLLGRLGARPKVLSYHAHSNPRREADLVDALRGGTDVALVTDAGTPGISDPGRTLVEAVRTAGGPTVPIPGPSAVTAALSVSGMSADRYLFLGFLPRKGRDRARLLEAVATSPWSVVLFEAPGRLADLLGDLGRRLAAGRRVLVARELTKVHEELRDGTVEEQLSYWSEREPRGEVTVVIEGLRGEPAPAHRADPDAARELATELLGDGLSARDIARMVAERTGLPRNEAYRLVTDLT